MPINQKYLAPFSPDKYYHVFNRSHSGKLMFSENDEYIIFLDLCKKYLTAYFQFFAYCLLPNHFHLFLQVKDENIFSIRTPVLTINDLCVQQFRNLFISYTNKINKKSDAHGGIFSTPFRRVNVEDDIYFTQLIFYIHTNPVHHCITNDFTNYQYSSYKSFLSSMPTLLEREMVLEWFGDKERFIKYHRSHQVNIPTDFLIE